MTVIPLHLELSGLSVELLPMARHRELNEPSVLLNVSKTFTLCVCVFKMMGLHSDRISLHFNF